MVSMVTLTRGLYFWPLLTINNKNNNPSVSVGTIVNDVHCWRGCIKNKRQGPCEDVCGVGKYCCRKGKEWEDKGCPIHLVNAALEYRHTCVEYGRFITHFVYVIH